MTFEWLLFGLRLLATAVLYTFLGLAFYLIWRSLQPARYQPESGAKYHLRVLTAESDPALSVGSRLMLQPDTQLGRDPANTIVLRDAAASGQHARLHRDSGVWWLEDMGSRNGTLLNDLPLTKPATLAEGDVIAIGGTRLRLESESQGNSVTG